jgi:hypothetical protein
MIMTSEQLFWRSEAIELAYKDFLGGRRSDN